MSCVSNNTINISDELINLICHNPEIQRLAITNAMNRRTSSGDRVPITPVTLTEIASKLAMLRWDDQIGSVKRFIRNLLGHNLPVDDEKHMMTTLVIEGIPSVLKLSDAFGGMSWMRGDSTPGPLLPMCQVFDQLTVHLLDHVTPSPPDLRLPITQMEEKKTE